MSLLVSGTFAKEIDRYAIDRLGIPSLRLMERASRALADEAERMLGELGKAREPHISFFCGTGNNGADGLCCAFMLLERGYQDIDITVTGKRDKRTEEFIFHEGRLKAAGIDINYYEESGRLTEYDPDEYAPDMAVDALFGIGLKREVRGAFLETIDFINELKVSWGSRIISADVPSGLDSDRGLNMCGDRPPVKADLTVTFGFAKTGLFLGGGQAVSGRVITADIGYPEGITEYIPHNNTDIIEITDEKIDKFRYRLKHRGPNANKSTYKKLLLLAGSRGMAGAAYLSGLAALRSGIGMVRYFGPEENRIILQTLLPEAMYESFGKELQFEGLNAAFSWADCYLLGPGLSVSKESEELVRAFARLWQEKREDKSFLIIDADGLNILAGAPELRKLLFSEKTVITPHVGEMARLTGSSISDIKSDLLGAAEKLAHSEGVNVILKDAVTAAACADGSLSLNIKGSAALAKAGSGDVLSGTVAGISAVLGGRLEDSLPIAVYIHGMAGAAAAGQDSEHGVLAREVADSIPKVMGSL